MNEFIVWDKFNEVFYKRENFKTLKLFFSMIFSCIDGDNGLTYHNYIEKTDIEGNKIYADSSVVKIAYGLRSTRRVITGYFTYNKNSFKYDFIFLNGVAFELNLIIASNFKIIDNLQENKLGLIGDKDEN